MNLYYLFFIMLFFQFNGNDKPGNDTNGKTFIKHDSIYFINKTKIKLGFYYNDKFLDIVRLHLLPGSSSKIFAETELVLTQTNNNQNFYLLFPGDTIYVTASSSGDAIFSVDNNIIRNNELDLSRRMNEQTPLNFYKLAFYRQKYFDKDYKKLDSIYNADYKAKIEFLDKYIKTNPVSAGYENRIRNKLKSDLYANELWLGTSTKCRIDNSFSDYLFELKPAINTLVSKGESLDYFWLQTNYIRFLLKDLINTDYYRDSLYADCKKEINKNIKEKVLFDIVKEEIQKDASSTKWFINDFINTGSDSDYKRYVVKLIENNKLYNSAGKNNIVINDKLEKIKYDSLLSSLKGNVVYIDFWASWCAPCRAEMPKSSILREKYRNDKIKFLYLSIDEDISAWKKVNEDEKLNNYPLSFLLLNSQRADLMKLFKITGIPRFIIIDKAGKIVNSNAPRPSDPELERLLEKYKDL